MQSAKITRPKSAEELLEHYLFVAKTHSNLSEAFFEKIIEIIKKHPKLVNHVSKTADCNAMELAMARKHAAIVNILNSLGGKTRIQIIKEAFIQGALSAQKAAAFDMGAKPRFK